MHVHSLDVEAYLKLYRTKNPLLIDTRSEKEFSHAHIPGAVNIPILNNEHRHIVGTLYKQEGREAAVLKGFELVGPLFREKMETAMALASGREVLVYCWRGGMRSNILGWLLKMAGLKVTLLDGGYKSFRHYVLPFLEKKYPILILGGQTGSGKTEILHRLRNSGEYIIDLEQLASHKGSAFGLLGQPEQPSQEQFENKLALELEAFGNGSLLWLENESRLIGRIVLPPQIFQLMRDASVIELQVAREQREQRIHREYCGFDAGLLAQHTHRIAKRLGPQHLKKSLEFLHEGNKTEWMKIILDYYDKTYTHSNAQRDSGKIRKVAFDWDIPEQGTGVLIAAARKEEQRIN